MSRLIVVIHFQQTCSITNRACPYTLYYLFKAIAELSTGRELFPKAGLLVFSLLRMIRSIINNFTPSMAQLR